MDGRGGSALIIRDTRREDGREYEVNDEPIVHVNGLDSYDGGYVPKFWSEINIFESDRYPYVVEKRGMTSLPDRENYSTIRSAHSIFQVYDALLMKSKDPSVGSYMTVISDVAFYRLVSLHPEWRKSLQDVAVRSSTPEQIDLVERIFRSYKNGNRNDSRFSY